MSYRNVNVNVNINGNIEFAEMVSPYINLIAAIFEQARDDWEKAWKKYSKFEKDYDYIRYKNDLKSIKTIDKNNKEYILISKKINIYSSTIRDINELQKFLHSKWLESICGYCNIDIEDVQSEFNKIKNNIIH